MGLYKSKKVNDTTQLWVWKVEETFEYLYDHVSLTEESEFRLQGMKSHAHQKAFLAVRMLLQEAGYTDYDMYYESDGKPYLLDDHHLSITHSFEFVALLIADKPCGIDVEKQRTKIIRIADKFLHQNEDLNPQTEEEEILKLTVVWCIKEAAYKLLGLPNVSFKQNIEVTSFRIKQDKVDVVISLQDESRTFESHFEIVESFVMAYIVA